jgi:hypothetical protein
MNKVLEARRQLLATARGALKTPVAWFPCDDPTATVEPPRPAGVPFNYVWQPWHKVPGFGSGHEYRDTVEAGWAAPDIRSSCG